VRLQRWGGTSEYHHPFRMTADLFQLQKNLNNTKLALRSTAANQARRSAEKVPPAECQAGHSVSNQKEQSA